MAAVELNEETFKEAIDSEGIVLVDFWAPWCGPCRAFAPVFEKVSEKHTDIKFAKLNTENEQAVAQAMRIQAIPTLMLFRDGILVFNQAGALPEPALEELIEKAKGLDMDQVRKELAETQGDA